MFTVVFFIPFATSTFKVLDNNTNDFILKLSVLRNVRSDYNMVVNV